MYVEINEYVFVRMCQLISAKIPLFESIAIKSFLEFTFNYVCHYRLI